MKTMSVAFVGRTATSRPKASPSAIAARGRGLSYTDNPTRMIVATRKNEKAWLKTAS